jgi:hypothetical protein
MHRVKIAGGNASTSTSMAVPDAVSLNLGVLVVRMLLRLATLLKQTSKLMMQLCFLSSDSLAVRRTHVVGNVYVLLHVLRLRVCTQDRRTGYIPSYAKLLHQKFSHIVY